MCCANVFVPYHTLTWEKSVTVRISFLRTYMFILVLLDQF